MGSRYLTLLACLLLAACAHPPAPEPEFAGVYRNACLPEAIAMAQSLKRHGIEARVLGIYTEKWGHAVTTYLYPPGANKLWAWDATWKSLRVRAWTSGSDSIARNWLSHTHPGTTLKHAQFLDTP